LVSVFFRGVDHASTKCQKSNLMNSTNCKLATAFGTPFVTYFRFQILDFTFQISDFLLGAPATPLSCAPATGGRRWRRCLTCIECIANWPTIPHSPSDSSNFNLMKCKIMPSKSSSAKMKQKNQNQLKYYNKIRCMQMACKITKSQKNENRPAATTIYWRFDAFLLCSAGNGEFGATSGHVVVRVTKLPPRTHLGTNRNGWKYENNYSPARWLHSRLSVTRLFTCTSAVKMDMEMKTENALESAS